MLLKELESFIEEDIGYNDVSCSIVPDHRVQAEVVSNEDGIAAGISEAAQIFEYFDILATTDLTEGSAIKKDDTIFTLDGGARSILRAERLALNFLGRMSGIATLTRRYVDRANGVRIAGTRKTTPGFRKFEKKAVIAGGGDPHRFNLSDTVMIKDNHIAVLGLERAVSAARERASFTQKIEVEVEDMASAIHAAEMGADIIMFDNMAADEIEKTIKTLADRGIRDGIILEASGGISLENIGDYARTGIDVISLGALTHSSRWLDISLRIKQIQRTEK
ncbi:nicotinate-nucleotide pyrophosphorylase (carboxylating) [Candidatus Methanoperedens nitroreducens]|uniref:Nicotinate-nucleotide pyrophosphorylase [carboxylating] n=1 Tax=Candidatus Methanoperedens nitratireducens TaxID=1392998 RepID=A0A062VBB1_9EURY|nr:carboxylating nicotinate-nucleotide diphosphorylase [Candidatus Methanoperedens nitroreducens]KCZ72605.1 nicotinate-nucleotide pyrophosphorylase (carboxylating) [Candidatus Methanoperedens nitroreducens]MDJ1423463.1 carboxylating nicotinate-nucleotide diphosphorylase [Candidatus Methanoperedens sp.]